MSTYASEMTRRQDDKGRTCLSELRSGIQKGGLSNPPLEVTHERKTQYLTL